MARGWESKSVEAQKESMEHSRRRPIIAISQEQLETERTRDGLLLHRTRVLHDLEACQNDRYRKTLTDGLTFLEAKLTALGWTGPR
jgi:hypothetical protein